jgi:hypothetical protein
VVAISFLGILKECYEEEKMEWPMKSLDKSRLFF